MSLAEYFDQTYNSDDIKSFLDLVGAERKPTRKAERIQALVHVLTSPREIRRLWQEMDELARKVLVSAYHNDGIFYADAFVAQYGELPQRPKRSSWSWYGEYFLLDVFIRSTSRYQTLHNVRIHPELMPLLAPLMPPPDRFQLAGLEEAPPQIFLHAEPFDLHLLETERAGHHDLLLFLTLLNQGEISISHTGLKLTGKSVEVLRSNRIAGPSR